MITGPIALITHGIAVLGINGATSGDAGTAGFSTLDTTGANLLVVSQTWSNGFLGGTTPPPLSDAHTGCANPCNTWQHLSVYLPSGAGGDGPTTIWYALNASVGTNHTFKSLGTVAYPTIGVQAFSNANTIAPFDVGTGNTRNGSSGTTVSPGTITPTNDNSVIVTAVSNYTDATASQTVDASFTRDDRVGFTAGTPTGLAFATAHLIQTAKDATGTTTWTWGNTVNYASSPMAVFGQDATPHVTIAPSTVVGYYQSSNNTGNLSGDTWIPSAWAPASLGGGTYGQVNDPATAALASNCSTGVGVCAAMALTINATAPTANSTNITLAGSNNAMSGYTISSATDCNTGNWKSDASWYRNGIMYRHVYRQAVASFFACSATIIMSPDNGVHTCNIATYAAGGSGGVNTCDSGNWSTTGAVPPAINSTYFEWLGSGVNDDTHPMSQLAPIQSYQDGETCVPIPGDGGCFYDLFYNQDGQRNNIYLARIAKSASPMVATNWQYWQGGDIANNANWTSGIATSAVVTTMGAWGYFPTAIWLPNLAAVIICGSNNGLVAIVCTSMGSPEGPIGTTTVLNTMKCPAPHASIVAYGGPTLIPSTLRYSAPNYTIILASSGTTDCLDSGDQTKNGYSPFFTLVTFSP